MDGQGAADERARRKTFRACPGPPPNFGGFASTRAPGVPEMVLGPLVFEIRSHERRVGHLLRTTATLMFAKRAVGGLKAVAAATKPSSTAFPTTAFRTTALALCAVTPQRKLGSSIFLSPSTQQRLASSVASHNLPSTPTSEPWLSPPPQNEPLPSLNEAAVTAPELSRPTLQAHSTTPTPKAARSPARASHRPGILDYRS